MTSSFYRGSSNVYLVQTTADLSAEEIKRLEWLLEAKKLSDSKLDGPFLGSRKEMLTPWSTNATEMAQNIGVKSVTRVEEFTKIEQSATAPDPMLQAVYPTLTLDIFDSKETGETNSPVTNIKKFSDDFGLALSDEEVTYLQDVSKEIGRELTDAEIYGFGQINSEHCRHKIFRGAFVIDGQPRSDSLFDLIRKTSKASPDNIVSAYSDNVAFIKGPSILEFTPAEKDKPSQFQQIPVDSVISIKAETHNFPTTVEPFNGASTGSGGEIRDRMAGGQGSLCLSGTAVYMTSYPRMKGSRKKTWEEKIQPRKWKYQSPEQILIKASDGASDFGNKFGQPLLVGSLLTAEFKVDDSVSAFDRTIMLAGGVGYARKEYSLKKSVEKGDAIILLGGDNYRIGMAGSSASSVDTGTQSSSFELNAIQRANAEMQKRVYNTVRILAEHPNNPIKTIHDHGAGGHMNCLTELIENIGGRIDLDALPKGDPTLSHRELLSNESQERIGMVVDKGAVALVRSIAEREKAPFYEIGTVTGDNRIEFYTSSGNSPVDLPLSALLGSSPKITLRDETRTNKLDKVTATFSSDSEFKEHLFNVLSLEGVACKDWLTNKVDRCVTAKIAQQQNVGPLQLPLSNYSISTLDYVSNSGVATSLGHACGAGLVDPEAGSVLSIAEALTNIIFVPLKNGLKSVTLSANWMWPAKQEGENSRLYAAVEACSRFAIELGLAIPTGKDSLSMTMNYPDGSKVKAPGTVIITAVGETDDFRKRVTPELKPVKSKLIYVPLHGGTEYNLGGSSYAQTLAALGDRSPNVRSTKLFADTFGLVQTLLREKALLAGHDVSSGGLITTLAEMSIVGDVGCKLSLKTPKSSEMLFSEEPGVVIQVLDEKAEEILNRIKNINPGAEILGEVDSKEFKLETSEFTFTESVSKLRDVWFEPSFLLDSKQCGVEFATSRAKTISTRGLNYKFPANFSGSAGKDGIQLIRTEKSGIKAAVIRDKGTNGDRELAFALYSAGFDVVDVTMSDLVEGREDLSSVKLVGFPGGFSNSDVLGSGKGWAGSFRYNEKALNAITNFTKRPDTLLLGICNGCQLVAALELMYPEHDQKIKLKHNSSKKFESSFLSVKVEETPSIFLKPLIGSELGIWVAHGEGHFELPEGEAAYNIALKYSKSTYPENPNGSPFNAAGISSKDGRTLIMMPHLERSIFPWNWGYYPSERNEDEISPWLLSFRAAFDWCKGQK
jgi:phosphoribosylformylglycinamidine synthase